MIPAPRLAEMRLKKGQFLRAEIGAGEDAQPVHLLRRLRPDAVKAPDLQLLDKGRARTGRDDALSIGLVLVRGELGEELVVGNAGRGGQSGSLEDPRPDLGGRLRRR